jgi:hypothetical protein
VDVCGIEKFLQELTEKATNEDKHYTNTRKTAQENVKHIGREIKHAAVSFDTEAAEVGIENSSDAKFDVNATRLMQNVSATDRDSPDGVKVWGTAPTRCIGARKKPH